MSGTENIQFAQVNNNVDHLMGDLTPDELAFVAGIENQYNPPDLSKGQAAGRF